MNCHDVRERLSPLLEDRLGAGERARVSEHLLACPGCRSLRDEMRDLLGDLHALAASQEVPEGLADRVLARVPAPAPRVRRPSARRLAWRRAAAWAFVFFGAWWQLVGTRLGEVAADEVAPAAASIVAEAREATLRRQAELFPEGELGLSQPIGRARDSLAAFSRTLHRALFVPEPPGEARPQTRPAAAPSDGDS